MILITVLSVLGAEEINAKNGKGIYEITVSISDGTHEERKTLLVFRYFCPELPCTGEFLSGERYDALLLADESSRAARKAVDLLACGDQTAKALSEKLRSRGFSKEAISEALRYVLEKRYIREDEQLERFMRQLCDVKRYGLRRIRQEVFAKGFSEECVKTHFAEFAETLDFSSALDVRLSKLRGGIPEDADARRKLIASLMRYGFSPDEIKRAFHRFAGE